MLKTRVIPTLLWKNECLVKGIGFDSWRRIGSVLPAIKVYNLRDVDELILVDIAATLEKREPDYSSVSEFSAECFVPLTVGGGVGDLDVIRKLLLSGADKITINSAAYENPEFITQAAKRFGSQCIIVSIDARRKSDGSYECHSHSGTRSTGREVGAWAAEAEKRGAGEILITSIEHDGTMKGYDLDLIRHVTQKVSIPVIASGGAGCLNDFYAAILQGKAAAIAAASIFHFTEKTPLEVKEHLRKQGIHVRGTHTDQPGKVGA
ncbi:MAG TPA: imidazole glycerol phosphate synthase cyclase subunit [Candidatus Omnitrophota bacterium]|nr:imidazole glycerol phosphate synthase cyclase subunit [Candidatus Omnitrophota bacterium]